MKLEKMEGLKRYGPEEFTTFAFEILEKTAKENPQNIEVKFRKFYRSEPVETLKEVHVYRVEKEKHDERICFELWGEYTLDTNGVPTLDAVIAKLKGPVTLIIEVCVQLLVPLAKDKYVVKLFDKLFVVEWKGGSFGSYKSRDLFLFDVRFDLDPREIKDTRFYEITSVETLCKIIDAMPV